MLNIVPLGWLRGAFLPRDTNQCNVCGSKSEGIRVLPTKTWFWYMYEDSQRDMDNKMIDINAYLEQWKKDRMMVALFDALEDIQEPRPAILDEMIQKRSLEIFPKLREASLETFSQRKDEIFSTDDYHETLNRLGDLVYGEFRKLTDEERELLILSIEYRDMVNEHWTWYEWDVASELLSMKPKSA